VAKQEETEKGEPTDAQKFEDAMRAILAAPKQEVMQELAVKKEERKKRRSAKQN